MGPLFTNVIVSQPLGGKSAAVVYSILILFAVLSALCLVEMARGLWLGLCRFWEAAYGSQRNEVSFWRRLWLGFRAFISPRAPN